ncbi:MAG: DUF167 domain-containing protein [Dehalococcoidales bacterium]|nr:DUF167 domain-containing protein [Dehalococcoidales bacterium]
MVKHHNQQMPLNIVGTETTAKIAVQISPGASKNEITGIVNDILRIKIAAPPVKGKANKELIDYLSHLLCISKDRLDILKGHTSKNKLISIDGLSKVSALEKLLSSTAP